MNLGSFSLPKLLIQLLCIISSLVLFACAERPKDAPEDFQELTSFLYEHFLDEDDEVLKVGLENIYDWLNENTTAVRKGYTVKHLSAEAIATTGKSSDPNELIGGAALTAHQHDLDSLARAFGVDNVLETNGDSYTKYERTFEGDPDCFDRKECKILEGDSRSTSEWAGIVKLKYDSHIQFRWVKTKYGYIMLQRSFMNKKPEINLDIIDAKEGYYLALVLPPMSNITETDNMDDMETIEVDQSIEMMEDIQEVDSSNLEGTLAENTEEEFIATELNVSVDEAVVPREDWGKSSLLQVNWIDVDYGILPVTEDRALEMLVESLIEVAVATEKWMNKTYTK